MNTSLLQPLKSFAQGAPDGRLDQVPASGTFQRHWTLQRQVPGSFLQYHLPEDESPPKIATTLKIESTSHSCHPLWCPEDEESHKLESTKSKLGRVSSQEVSDWLLLVNY